LSRFDPTGETSDGLDTLLCHDLYFLTVVEGENEDKDAHPASRAEKQIPIF